MFSIPASVAAAKQVKHNHFADLVAIAEPSLGRAYNFPDSESPLVSLDPI
jgi:hypothetical protein